MKKKIIVYLLIANILLNTGILVCHAFGLKIPDWVWLTQLVGLIPTALLIPSRGLAIKAAILTVAIIIAIVVRMVMGRPAPIPEFVQGNLVTVAWSQVIIPMLLLLQMWRWHRNLPRKK